MITVQDLIERLQNVPSGANLYVYASDATLRVQAEWPTGADGTVGGVATVLTSNFYVQAGSAR